MITTQPVAGDVTTQLVSLALNASLARHAAIATNIANANTEGYRPVRVSFDEQIALVQDRLVNRRYDASAPRLIESLQRSMRPSENLSVAKVQLDAETAHMVQNAVHYQALLAAHNKMHAITRLAISGGR